MAEQRRILSIDGGGVRGIIPAAVLAALEKATGKPTRDHFDFLAGTSTGAVLAGALAAGIPAERLMTLYERRGRELFRKVPGLSTLRRILTGTMYDVRTLSRMLAEELDVQAGWHMNDVPNDIMITSKGLDDGHQWYFVKDRPGEKPGRTGGLRLVDCVTASSAAPTYFGPWDVPPLGLLVDGGTGVAGNPTYQACVEAFEYTTARYAPKQTTIVSLGTGRYLQRQRPTWIMSWLEWILSELLRSPGEQQTELVQRHYAAARFYRIDVKLERDFKLDSISAVAELRRIGEKLAATIDWPAILAGDEKTFEIDPKKVRPAAYLRAV
jgi:patatin-like phospholipase/acyl hydrolase